MTPLSLTQIAKVIQDTGFEPKDSTLRTQLSKLLGESYYHYQTKDRTVMQIRLATTKFSQPSLKRVLNGSNKRSITNCGTPRSLTSIMPCDELHTPNGGASSVLSPSSIDYSQAARRGNPLYASPLSIPNAISKLRQLHSVMEIDDDLKHSPWVEGASADQTLVDFKEEHSSLSDNDDDYFSHDCHIYWKQVLHDTAGYSPRDVKSKVDSDSRDNEIQRFKASSFIIPALEEDVMASSDLNAYLGEPNNTISTNRSKRFSKISLKRRLGTSNNRTSTESSSSSLVRSVMNLSIAESSRSSWRSSAASNATGESEFSRYSRYRRPALKPLLRIINSFFEHKPSPVLQGLNPDNMHIIGDTRTIDDALIFWCLLSSSRDCCDISSLLARTVQRCSQCGLSLDHYLAREFPRRESYVFTGNNVEINLCARDFFNNTPLHYLAASELDIDSKLTLLLRPTAPLTAINYLGQTFLHLLNPKSLGPCLKRLPGLLETLATRGFPFHMRDHNGRTFFHTLLRYAGVAATDYITLRQVLRIIKSSVHSRARYGPCLCRAIALIPSCSAETEQLHKENASQNKCNYDYCQRLAMSIAYMSRGDRDSLRNLQHGRYVNGLWVRTPVDSIDYLYRLIRRLKHLDDLDWVDVNGDTLLGALVEHWQPPKTQHITHEKDLIIKEIIDQGADCNIMNRAGKTPLFMAVEGGQDTVVEIILKSPDIRLQDYSCEILVSTTHGTMEKAREKNNHELEIASMRILALLGAEIVNRRKADLVHRGYEIAMCHAMALRSISCGVPDSFISKFIDPNTLRLASTARDQTLYGYEKPT
ncbi:hypothetical protein MMC17_007686 [Xylographa soralifera]|nr:hypothetical protein [Xylographa soralifera]